MQKDITSFISNNPEDTIQFAKNFSRNINFGTVIFMTVALNCLWIYSYLATQMGKPKSNNSQQQTSY